MQRTHYDSVLVTRDEELGETRLGLAVTSPTGEGTPNDLLSTDVASTSVFVDSDASNSLGVHSDAPHNHVPGVQWVVKSARWVNDHVAHVTRVRETANGRLYLRYGPSVLFCFKVSVLFRPLKHFTRNGHRRGYVGSGQKHRIGGPAYEYTNGSYEYWEYGSLHRDGGPAVWEAASRSETYWRRGVKHREDGPAVTVYLENGDTIEHYYLYGVSLTKTEWLCEVLEKRVANESEAQALTALAPTWDGTPDELLATIRILEGDAVAVHESTKIKTRSVRSVFLYWRSRPGARRRL